MQMRKMQNKIKGIRGPHPTPAPSLRVPDHPHSTMLIEGGQETGAGVGWGINVGGKLLNKGGRDMEEKESKEQKQGNKNEVENVIKVTIARDLADGLTELVKKVNDGFAAGRVHRQDVVSWVIAKFLRNYSDSDLQQIREAHYDETTMFDAMYRKMKETGEVPEFLRDAMRKHFRGAGDGLKKSKKGLISESINDGLVKYEDVA
jgi:hypothetical protein